MSPSRNLKVDEAPLIIVPPPSRVAVIAEVDEVFVTLENPKLNVDPILVINPGPQGPRGTPGPPGQSGSGLFSFIFEQLTPDTTWFIQHDLTGYPSVTVVDSANRQVEGDIEFIDPYSLTVSFSAPFAGHAYLS